jgi:hypothetical protein
MQAQSRMVVYPRGQVEELAIGGYAEITSIAGVADQIPEAAGVVEALPNVDGVVSNYNGVDSGLPALGLVATLVNTLSGTVEAVLGSLPVVNEVLPTLPVGTGVLTSGRAPGTVELVDSTLSGIPATIDSGPPLPLLGDLHGTAGNLPLIGELLAATHVAMFSLIPDLLVVVS